MPETQSSSAPSTLAQALLNTGPQSQATLRFLDRRERPTEILWSEMSTQAQQVAGQLIALGVQPGERVVLIYATEPEFFRAFFGCILAGAVPCPVYPPVRLGRMELYHQRTARMVELASARLMLSSAKIRRVLGGVVELVRPALGCRTLEQLPQATPQIRSPEPGDLAMVQFSSGTTVDPKPVALTHAAVLAQTRAIVHHIQLDSSAPKGESGVCWLPLYHDMGLIGCVFPSLLIPGDLTLISPENFIGRPASWLRALSTYGASVSPAPNFAYGLCLDRVKDSELEGVDLSRWRVALNGAEPVAPAVLRAFVERFSKWGFQPQALSPVYGLSEASLAVTFSDLNAPFVSHHFDRDALAQGRAVIVDSQAQGGSEIVSVGPPVRGFEVEIRKGAQVLPELALGTVWARGPSLMKEYLGRPELTAAALVKGWLNTGDQGFLYRGELYLSGREKDLLILNGRNHAPHPVEQAVDGLPGVRTGCAAAVSTMPQDSEQAASEQLLLFVEHSALSSQAERGALPQVAREAVLSATGLRCEQVVVLPPGTLPRTSSGKLRRSEALRQYQSGELVPPDQVHLLKVAGIFARSALGYLRSRD